MDIVAPEGDFGAAFCALFKDYYAELGCDEDVDHLLDEYVLADFSAGLLDIAVAAEDGRACGFVIFQTDSIENEWCLKEGLGTVRELYVIPEERCRGVGGTLCAHAEAALKNRGAVRAYVLPAEGSEAFFLARLRRGGRVVRGDGLQLLL